MKKIILFMLFSFTLSASTPDLKFKYAVIFDMWCSKTTGTPISNEERKRLISVYPKFQVEWDKLGPKLLERTVKEFGKDFASKDLLAGVFLCKKTPSMGFPLLINGNWFAKEGKAAKDPKQIVYITFHEVLHSYLENNFPKTWSTKLSLKHRKAGASMRVLAHLHLMAIQHHVFTKLGLKKELTELIKLEKSYSHAGYKEAWAIVEKEGAQAFVDELI